MKTMTTGEAIKYTYELLESFDIRGWRVIINPRTKRVGGSASLSKVIEISQHLIDNASEQSVLEVIKHEVAHAIDINRRGFSNHDAVWRDIAIAVGANPRARSRVVWTTTAYKYSMECPKCGPLGGRHRMDYGASYSCVRCKSKVKIKQNY